MKKLTLILLAVICCFTLYACGDNGNNNDVVVTPAVTMKPETPAPTPVPGTPAPTSKPVVCPTCHGLGGCPAYCDGGYEECWECLGSGQDFCMGFHCLNGICSECLGSGEIDEYDFHGGIRTRRCSYCSGTGECRTCRGTGTSTCQTCHGSGMIRCAACSGTGRCPTCGK